MKGNNSSYKLAIFHFQACFSEMMWISIKQNIGIFVPKTFKQKHFQIIDFTTVLPDNQQNKIWVNSQTSFPKDCQHTVLAGFSKTIFPYIGHSSLGSCQTVFEVCIGYISVTVLLIIGSILIWKLLSSLIPTGQSGSVYAKQIIAFQNL